MLEGVAARPEFRAAAVVHELSELPQRSEKSKHRDRIQDKTLAEMSDTGTWSTRDQCGDERKICVCLMFSNPVNYSSFPTL